MTLPLIITALFGISLAWLVRLIALAPEGYELPGIGFRYGRQPLDDELRRLANRDGRTSPVSAPFHASSNTTKKAQNHGR